MSAQHTSRGETVPLCTYLFFLCTPARGTGRALEDLAYKQNMWSLDK